MPQLHDIPAALGLLSRLPVRVNETRAMDRGARAAWAYPLAGLVLALIAGMIAQLTLWLGLPAPLVAGLTLAALIVMTGAMHEDGLADAADGLWGGWDKTRRLEIMKDSRIGVYGVVALALGLGLRWQALILLIGAGTLWPALIVTAMLSRAAMVCVMAYLPSARTTGLSQSVGRPSRKTALIAAGIAIIFAFVFWKIAALWLLFAACLATLICAAIAKAKIGGQTGDILGATQQITEIVILLALASQLP